jgi:hypothetical protein
VAAGAAETIAAELEEAVTSVAEEFGINIGPELEKQLASTEKVTVGSVRKILKEFSGNLVKLATRVKEETALEMAHGDEGLVLQPEEMRGYGEELNRQYPNRIHETMAQAEKPTRLLSEGVFGVPRASNQQDLLYTGKENAKWARQYPEIFMDGIATYGKLDRNDPRLIKFAMSVADEFEKAGERSITESDFSTIVTKVLSEEMDETIRGLIQEARRTYKTVQQTNIGSSTKRRYDPGAGDSFVELPGGGQIGRKPGEAGSYIRRRPGDEDGLRAYEFHKQVAMERALQLGLPKIMEGTVVPVIKVAVSDAVAEGAKRGAKESSKKTPAAVEQGLNESTERNSPPKAAIKIGRDYGFALNGALRDLIPRVRVSGEAFGIAAVTGMTTVTPAMMQHLNQNAGRILRPYLDAQTTMVPIAKQKVIVLDREAIAAKRASDAQVLNTIAMNGLANAAMAASMGVQTLTDEVSSGFVYGGGMAPGGPGRFIAGKGRRGKDKQEQEEAPGEKTESKFARFSSGFRTATFALTSLAGAATMSGGAVGEAAGSIMAFSGVAYALITVMDLLSLAATNSKNAMLAQIGSFLMFSRGKAGGGKFLTELASKTLPLKGAFTAAGGGLKGFIAVIKNAAINVGKFVTVGLRFVPVLGWIITAITAFVIITNLISEAKEKERLATEGVAEAMRKAKDAIPGLSELLGKAKTNTLAERLAQGSDATDSKEKVSLVTSLTTGEQSEDFKKQFGELIESMKSMSKAEVETVQNTLALQLQSTGQYAQDEIESIIKAIQIKAGTTDVVFEFKSIDITSKNFKGFKLEMERISGDLQDALSSGANETRVAEAVNTSSEAYVQTLTALSDALYNGVISAEEYENKMNILTGTVLSSAKAQEITKEMMEQFTDVQLAGRPAMAALANNVKRGSDRLFVMGGVASGAIPDLLALTEVIDALNTIAAFQAGDSSIDEAMYKRSMAVKLKYEKIAAAKLAAIEAGNKNGSENDGGTKEKTPWETATEQLRNQTKEMSNASTAYNKLVKAGVGARDAFEAAKDPALSAALATTKVGTSKWKELVGLIKEFNANAKLTKVSDTLKNLANENTLLTKFDKLSRYLQQMGLSGEDIQSVIGDPDLAEGLIYATGEGTKGLADINKYIAQIKANKEIRISILPLADQFKERMQKVSEWFSNEKNALEIKLRIDTKADSDIVRKAQQQIDTLNFQADDFEAGLTRLEDGEEAINEKYDNRIEALDKVIAANDRIAEQNKEELNIFQMVARGDISGAAAAIAQLQQQKAKDALNAKRESLEAQRKNELESLTAEVMVNGQKVMMSRNDIEENLKNIKQQIFEIEEKTLEPAQRRIEILTAIKENEEASLKVLGLTEDEWLNIESNIDLAKTRTTEYLGELQKALDVARQIPGALAGTSKSGQEIVGRPDIIPETDFGANPKILKPKPAPVPGGTPGGTPVVVPKPGDPGFVGPVVPEDSPYPPGYFNYLEAIDKFVTENIDYGKKPILEQIGSSGAHAMLMTDLSGKISEGMERGYAWAVKKFGAKDAKRKASNLGLFGTSSFWEQYNDKNNWQSTAVHRNIFKKFKPMFQEAEAQGFASGGYISGPGTGTSDSIPALLSNGEYVIRANAVKALGTDTLDRMNYADKNRFADGGFVDRRDAAWAARGVAQPNTKPAIASNQWWAKATSYKSAATIEAEAKAARAKLFKQGGAQGFEAGFQGMMSDFAKLEPVKAFGNFLGDKTNVASGITRGLLSALSLPVELMGSVAKTFVTGFGQASRGDLLGLAKTAFHVVTGGVIGDAVSNAISGVVNPEEQRASMFEQAAEQVIKDKTFGAGNAESDALARIIGGSLNLAGDPLSYLGIGAAAKGIKTAGIAASKLKPAPKGIGIKEVGGATPLADPNASLVKSVITGKLQHGSRITSDRTSFELKQGEGHWSNWFGADFFTTGSPDLAKTYGSEVFKLGMPLSQAGKMKIFDLYPGAPPMEKQFPGITSRLEKLGVEIDPRETIKMDISETRNPKEIQEFLNSPDRHTKITEPLLGEIFREFGIKAIRHQSGHGSGGSGYSEVFAFFNPENIIAKKKIIDKKSLKEVVESKTASAKESFKQSLISPSQIRARLESLKYYGRDRYDFFRNTVKEDPYEDYGFIKSTSEMSQEELASILSGKKGTYNQKMFAGLLAEGKIKNQADMWQQMDPDSEKLDYKVMPIQTQVTTDDALRNISLHGSPENILHPLDAEGAEGYKVVAKAADGTDAGHLYWKAKTGEIAMVFVNSKYQRKGVATDMWHKANLAALESSGRIVHPVHSPQLTNLGKPWSFNVGGFRLGDDKFINPQTGKINWRSILRKPNAREEYIKTLNMTQDEIYADQTRRYSGSVKAIGEDFATTTGQTQNSKPIYHPATPWTGSATGEDVATTTGQIQSSERIYHPATPWTFSKGGMVKPKFFAKGGMVMPQFFAKGGDVVPAMLTPGEFVVNKHAVQDYGVNNLKAINSGTALGNSVYNGYNINVNVKSNSNPDQIANAVMTQIRQVNAQQVRGNRF